MKQIEEKEKIERNGVGRVPRVPRVPEHSADLAPAWAPNWLADGSGNTEAAALKIAIQPPPAPQPFTDTATDTDVPQWPVWPVWDETGAKPCKWCQRPIIFGRIESDVYGDITLMRPDPKPRKWMTLDPDLMPHECGKQIATEPTAKEGATAA